MPVFKWSSKPTDVSRLGPPHGSPLSTLMPLSMPDVLPLGALVLLSTPGVPPFGSAKSPIFDGSFSNTPLAMGDATSLSHYDGQDKSTSDSEPFGVITHSRASLHCEMLALRLLPSQRGYLGTFLQLVEGPILPHKSA